MEMTQQDKIIWALITRLTELEEENKGLRAFAEIHGVTKRRTK